MQLPQNIQNYIEQRSISEEVIQKANISWNGSQIVIPVYDKQGNKLFNKYRRGPNDTDSPKYQYDKGAQGTLYNMQNITGDYVVITEGEFDALVLMSYGFNAVSPTSGSGSFKQEWLDMLDKRTIYIAYDNDEAGRKGAAWLHYIAYNSYILPLPDGMDITDYVKAGHVITDLMDKRIRLARPEKPTEQVFKAALQGNLEVRQKLYNDKQINAVDYLDAFFELLKSKRDQYTKSPKPKKIESKQTTNTVSADEVRHVPIDTFIKFTRSGFARCIWHDDETPSLKYYKDDNRVHCFGCWKNADVIDVVSHIYDVSFQEALQILRNYT